DSFAMVKIAIRDKKIYILGAKGWVGRDYIQVEEEIAEIHQTNPADLYVIEKNNTGDHVYEVLRYQKHLPVIAVTTSKDIKNREKHRDTMDKNEMVRWMLAMKQDHRIIFPKRDTAEIRELKRQLSIFAERMTESGSISYGAEGREHDDYVMALMLACFAARRKYFRPGSGRHFAVSSKGVGHNQNHNGHSESGIYRGAQSFGRTAYIPGEGFREF
ncbi:MAG: hypothetical protein ACRD32_07860, partial [Nitrososphaerales archaeon]